MNSTVDSGVELTAEMVGLFGILMLASLCMFFTNSSDDIGTSSAYLLFFWFATSQTIPFYFAGENVFTNSLLDYFYLQSAIFILHQLTSFLSILHFKKALCSLRMHSYIKHSPFGSYIKLDLKSTYFAAIFFTAMLFLVFYLWFSSPQLSAEAELEATAWLLTPILVTQLILTFELIKVGNMLYSNALKRKRYVSYAFVFNQVLSIILVKRNIPMGAFMLCSATGTIWHAFLLWTVFEAILPKTTDQVRARQSIEKTPRANFLLATQKINEDDRTELLLAESTFWKSLQENF